MSAAGRTARDLWCLVRVGGPRAALADLREIARRRVYMRTDQLVVRKDLPSEPRGTRTIRMQEAEPHHVPLLAELSRPRCGLRQAHRFAAGLAEGKRALLGFRDDRLIGYLWWHDAGPAADGFYLSRFGLGLADGEVYGYELFIAPEHRGHGTPAEFLAGVEAELVRLGYRRLVGFVDGGNVPARWLWATTGYEVVLRQRTRTVLRRLVHVDGRGWLLASGNRLQPLARDRARSNQVPADLRRRARGRAC